jgi:GxxExxY protein
LNFTEIVDMDLEEQIRSIAHDIYRELGPGYNECIYHRAFEVALRLNGIKYQSEVILPVYYKDHCIGNGRIDLLIENQIVVELKAVASLGTSGSTQLKNYLKSGSYPYGFVINFGQSTKKSMDNGLEIVKETLISCDQIHNNGGIELTIN